jgi:hypothetical protein
MFLPIITICSLLVAAAFAGVTWQVLREERRRTDARVAALGAMIDGPLDPATGPGGAQRAELFDTERPSAVRGAPLTKLAIGFAVAIVVIVAIAMTGGHPHAPQATATPTAAAGESPAAATAPLELISMRPERNGDTLTVTGLVRNVSPAPESGLIAVVFAFDRAGNFLSSARAPLELVTLQSGDESAFRVSVPNARDVNRYRVSFRTEAGVVRHLDRRGSMQASAN